MTPAVAPLFVPATRPDRFAKAAGSDADAIIIDLEDAVAPADKAAARSNLTAAGALSTSVIVRVNAVGSPWHAADLDAVNAADLDAICVPKAQSADELANIRARFTRPVFLIALIETAAGLEAAKALAGAANQLAFGPADFFLDLGMKPSTEMTGHALCRLTVASRAAGIPPPLDGPDFHIGDTEALSASCASAIACGAGGKLCIHPSQAGTVRRQFMPGADEVAWASRILETSGDGGVSVIDGQMIDAPLLARAHLVLRRSRNMIDWEKLI